MDTIDVNGVRLAYEQTGEGPPVVCVHGGWTDRHAWDAVAPALAQRYRVVTYDRRGHSESERPPGIQGFATQVADLAALIDALDAAPAHVVANSFGGEVALGLAVTCPDRVASLCLHEPPLFSILGDDPGIAELLADLGTREGHVADEIVAGHHDAGARLFVETIVLGPGAWEFLPDALRQTMAFNAPTFLDVVHDHAQNSLSAADLASVTVPVLLTGGAQSPRDVPSAAILDGLRATLPNADRYTFDEAGHIPHRTHPDDLARVVLAFLDDVTAEMQQSTSERSAR